MGAFEMQGVPAATPPPAVTDPAASIDLDAATHTIVGTASADALVRIYSDANNNGVVDGADAMVAQQQLTGGATAFSISTVLTQDTANDFLASAEVASVESSPADVPTINEDSLPPAAPVVIIPATPITVTGAGFSVIGTAEQGSLVRIYRDFNNNGIIDGADAVVGTRQLAPGGTAFTVDVPLAPGLASDFVATTMDAASNESAATNVPTVTETSPLAAAPVVTTPGSAVSVR